jgi:hypothetical protein
VSALQQHKQQQPGFRACLPTYFLLSWLHMLWLTCGYFDLGLGRVGLDLNSLFHVTAWPLYSLLYLLPTLGLTLLVRRLSRGRLLPKALTAVLLAVFTMLLIRTDALIYDLYAFHINSFVLNLIFTPGGISSLGSGSESFISFFLLAVRVLLIQSAFMGLALWQARRKPCVHIGNWRVASVLLGLFLVQGTVYGISDVGNHGPVLDSSKVYPLFQRVRFRSLAARFGFEHSSRNEFTADMDNTSLNYPLTEVPFREVPQPPNLIFLVAESLRWDQLTPETMPNTWQFSHKGLRFTQHYSSGNGTREGLFGMFYGLYGSYWENFMHAGQSPLLMDRLQQLDYQLDLRTSASFTYPEFDKTLFVNADPAVMHPADEALPPWRRDEVNTDELLSFLDTRDPSRPFMEFFFFESTHASYSFPQASALTQDYQQGVDYMQLSRDELAAEITPLYKRYRNSAHWVDIQLGRIYTKLAEQGLLENTIVIVTGDHGEEFMEKGAWGHNSAFVEEQTHVPLVVMLPQQAPAVVDRLTSHVDIATTLLLKLGAGADTSTWSLGQDLLATAPRPYIVLSDWHSIAVLTADLKYRIPYLNQTGADYWAPTDHADRLLGEDQEKALTLRNQAHILEAMARCTLFTNRQAGVHISGI